MTILRSKAQKFLSGTASILGISEDLDKTACAQRILMRLSRVNVINDYFCLLVMLLWIYPIIIHCNVNVKDMYYAV